MSSAAALSLAGGAWAVTAVNAEEPLTPYEQSLACKFSQTCDPDTLRNYSEDDADQETDGVIVGDEAPFNVFTSGNKQVAVNAAARQPAANRSADGPRLYTAPAGQRSASVGAGNASYRPAKVAVVQRTRPPVRRGAADMSVLFGNASAELDARSREEVAAWANVLNSPAFVGTAIRIEGHTNAVGGREYNLELSRRRAQAVKDVLVARGVDAARIEAVGFGFDKPRASNPRDTANRRVEIVKTN